MRPHLADVRMAAVLLVVLCALTGCENGENATKPNTILRVAVFDPLCAKTASACIGDAATRDYETIVEPVSRQTALMLSFSYFTSDDALANALASDKVDAVLTKAWTLTRIERDRGLRFERLADLARADGHAKLQGAFVVRTDSPAQSLADLDGKTVAFGSVPGGYEKSTQAREALREAGVTPLHEEVLDLCPQVLVAVYERKVDAGVVSDYVADLGGLKLIDEGGFRIVARTEGIPFITFAVAASVSEEQREALRGALLRIAGENVPTGLRSTGFFAPMPWTPRFEEVP